MLNTDLFKDPVLPIYMGNNTCKVYDNSYRKSEGSSPSETLETIHSPTAEAGNDYRECIRLTT